MRFLLEIPIIASSARWIWGVDEADGVSPKICLESLPFMNQGCWSGLLVKIVGVAIICGSFLNKAPVIRNILASKSTVGLARFSVYGETVVYANCAFYGILEGLPISAYGENVSMGMQSIIVVLLIWRYSEPKVSRFEWSLAVTVAAIYLMFVTMILPRNLAYVLMASIWPIMLTGRGLQIWETFRLKHTGAQSIVTVSMSLGGSAVRILTTLKEVGWDRAVLMGFFLSVTLNLILFLQYWAFYDNTKKFLSDLKSKKKD